MSAPAAPAAPAALPLWAFTFAGGKYRHLLSGRVSAASKAEAIRAAHAAYFAAFGKVPPPRAVLTVVAEVPR